MGEDLTFTVSFYLYFKVFPFPEFMSNSSTNAQYIRLLEEDVRKGANQFCADCHARGFHQTYLTSNNIYLIICFLLSSITLVRSSLDINESGYLYLPKL